MSSPADSKLIAALDIGSSKVSALIVTADDDGRLRVLGTDSAKAAGQARLHLRHGSERIRRARSGRTSRAYVRRDDRRVGQVWRGRLVSDVANVEVELGATRSNSRTSTSCSPAGATRSTAWAGRAPRPAGTLQIDGSMASSIRSAPRRSARGRHPRRCGRSGAAQEHRLCDPLGPFGRQGDRCFAGSGRACLFDGGKRELGVALVELGAEVTNVLPPRRWDAVGLRSIRWAKDITDDIACAFGVQRRDASG